MLMLGYKLMSEEHGPLALVRNVRRAEQAGFDFAAISHRFSPWLDSLTRQNARMASALRSLCARKRTYYAHFNFSRS